MYPCYGMHIFFIERPYMERNDKVSWLELCLLVVGSTYGVILWLHIHSLDTLHQI